MTDGHAKAAPHAISHASDGPVWRHCGKIGTVLERYHVGREMCMVHFWSGRKANKNTHIHTCLFLCKISMGEINWNLMKIVNVFPKVAKENVKQRGTSNVPNAHSMQNLQLGIVSAKPCQRIRPQFTHLGGAAVGRRRFLPVQGPPPCDGAALAPAARVGKAKEVWLRLTTACLVLFPV